MQPIFAIGLPSGSDWIYIIIALAVLLIPLVLFCWAMIKIIRNTPKRVDKKS